MVSIFVCTTSLLKPIRYMIKLIMVEVFVFFFSYVALHHYSQQSSFPDWHFEMYLLNLSLSISLFSVCSIRLSTNSTTSTIGNMGHQLGFVCLDKCAWYRHVQCCPGYDNWKNAGPWQTIARFSVSTQ